MSRNSFLNRVPNIRILLGWIFFPLLTLSGLYLLKNFFSNCSEVQLRILELGWLAPFVYLVLAVLSILCLVPRTLSVIVAGVCFGNWAGTLLAMTSSLLASALAFYLSGHFARQRFERLMHKREWFLKFELLAQRSGLSFVIFMRATHLIHYGLTNYACGLLPIRFSHFLWGTFIGILPGTAAVVYGGATLGCALVESGAALPPEVSRNLVIASVVLTLSSVLPLLWQHQKNRTHSLPKT